MRVLTISPHNKKGLISIEEADDKASQVVVFCIPIDEWEATRIRDINDFDDFFRKGISTKINGIKGLETIYLKYVNDKERFEVNYYPKFVANIRGFEIEFYLSLNNYLEKNMQSLSFDYYYDGYKLKNIIGKRLVILEPNLKQLDKLFVSQKIVFIDWDY